MLTDEAHGTHLYFGKGLPISGMAAGADMSAVSMHKSGGSLTQSSILLTGRNVNADYVRQIINLTQTTSASICYCQALIYQEEIWHSEARNPLPRWHRCRSTQGRRLIP